MSMRQNEQPLAPTALPEHSQLLPGEARGGGGGPRLLQASPGSTWTCAVLGLWPWRGAFPQGACICPGLALLCCRLQAAASPPPMLLSVKGE